MKRRCSGARSAAGARKPRCTVLEPPLLVTRPRCTVFEPPLLVARPGCTVFEPPLFSRDHDARSAKRHSGSRGHDTRPWNRRFFRETTMYGLRQRFGEGVSRWSTPCRRFAEGVSSANTPRRRRSSHGPRIHGHQQRAAARAGGEDRRLPEGGILGVVFTAGSKHAEDVASAWFQRPVQPLLRIVVQARAL